MSGNKLLFTGFQLPSGSFIETLWYQEAPHLCSRAVWIDATAAVWTAKEATEGCNPDLESGGIYRRRVAISEWSELRLEATGENIRHLQNPQGWNYGSTQGVQKPKPKKKEGEKSLIVPDLIQSEVSDEPVEEDTSDQA